MSTLTEGKVLSDVIKYERPLNGSRREMLVAASQTLVLGTVCRDGAGGRKVAMTDQTNEVHTVALTGLSAGKVMFGFTHPITGTVTWTDEMDEAATIAHLNTELDTLFTAGDVVASGTDMEAFAITYTGGLWGGVPVPLMQVQMGDAADADVHGVITRTTKGGGAAGAAADEIQTVTWGTVAVPVTATGGTFTITALDHSGTSVTTGTVAWNGSAANLQTALDAAFGTDRIIGACHTGADCDDGVILTFSGAGFSGVDQEPVTADVSSLTTVTAYEVVEGTKGRPGGTQDANSICIKAVTTSGGEVTTKTVFLTNTAVVNQDQLAWGAGDKQAAIDVLLNEHHIMMELQPTTTETQSS